MTLHLFLLTALIVTALAASMSRNFLYSAVWLALLSITLTGVMFSMNAQWAGIFELSVCAGLITVLFASTASLVGKGSKYAENERKYFRFLPAALLVFALILYFIFKKYNIAAPAVPPAVEYAKVGDIIWGSRKLDLIGQTCIFVAAVLMVRTFFKGGKADE
ncbi:NADH-quinone oxidoreductase subunit J [Parelusimicrobium proximum]|uniref:NADH-quinone oxidoreductase subunit J n=1 Tax=Parelusimicrobium proximum TaxID=3228953 RepID=UPI003D162646